MDDRDSPFRLGTRQKLRDLRRIHSAHRDEMGTVRGTVAMAATLGRFVALRTRTGRTAAPMVDDSVCIAIAMYRTLSSRLGEDRALDAVERVIVTSGLELMSGWVPEDRSMTSLGTQVRLVMGDAESRGVYGIDAMTSTATGIGWDVTACRYAELTRRLGSPEVGRVFCAVDQPFVADALPDIDFTCETTIARGDDRCRFRVGDQT